MSWELQCCPYMVLPLYGATLIWCYPYMVLLLYGAALIWSSSLQTLMDYGFTSQFLALTGYSVLEKESLAAALLGEYGCVCVCV